MSVNANVNEMTFEELGVGNPAVEAQQQVNRETENKAIDLYSQAKTIKAITGIDVLAEYRNNDNVRVRILNGEIDFIGLYREMTANNETRRVPQIVRNANGAMNTNINIKNMNAEQFDKLDSMLANGNTVSL